MDEKHQQKQERAEQAWAPDNLWQEEPPQRGRGGPGLFPPWWPRGGGGGGRVGPPPPAEPVEPEAPYWDYYRWRRRDRDTTSGWWIFFWIFMGIILLALLMPSVGGGVSVIGSSFTAVLGLVILFLAIWKVIDLIRYR